METSKVYKYPPKSFRGYFLFFECCILLGIVPLFLSLSPEQIEYKIGFVAAFPIATAVVYIVLKTNIQANNELSIRLKDKVMVYRDARERYEMIFERIKDITIGNIKKTIFQHAHRIITLDDGFKKISFANYITDQLVSPGFIAGFKRPDTKRGDGLFNLILSKCKPGKQARVREIY